VTGRTANKFLKVIAINADMIEEEGNGRSEQEYQEMY
jgi:hypothetical protein